MTVRTIRRRGSGFTLVELAVVVLIIALLLGGLLLTVSAQTDARAVADTRRTLESARDALTGFAIRNNRLPCPATTTSNGLEVPVGGGACTAAPLSVTDGFVPAATLGIGPTDAQGLLVDAWGNPIRYAVTQWTGTLPTPVFTTTNGIQTIGFATLAPDLWVCSPAGAGTTAAGPTNTDSTCPAGTLAFPTPAVVFSLGKNFAITGASSTDEQENTDRDMIFVMHAPVPADNAVGPFDDLVVWLSPNVLYNRLISAGAL